MMAPGREIVGSIRHSNRGEELTAGLLRQLCANGCADVVSSAQKVDCSAETTAVDAGRADRSKVCVVLVDGNFMSRRRR